VVRSSVVRTVVAGLATAAAMFGTFGQSGQGATAACPSGATMSIVAHPDDDLLFLSPDLLHDVQSSRCSRTVFVTAGDSGDGMGYGSIRESGIKAAYAQMAGVANSWTTSDAGIAGHPTPLLTLTGRPSVSVVFVRLPNAQSAGPGYASHNGETLQGLWEGSISQMSTVDGASSYTKAGLTAALTVLMTALQPDIIRTQDYVGTIGDGDHSDHHVAAFFARAAHTGYTSAHVFTGYLDYGSSGQPQNVFGGDLTAKQQALAAYAAYDLICGSPPSCSGTIYGNWALRQYTVGTGNGGGTPPSSPPVPTVSGLAPTSGPAGTSVTVIGTNLTGASSVRFNGAAASFTVNSATQITATVPTGATSGTVGVTTSDGTATSPSAFTVTAGPPPPPPLPPPGPTVTGLAPGSGPVGTSVTISGTNLTGASSVRFNGAAASFAVNSATQITATVPTGATSGTVAVTTSGGTATSSTSFAVTTAAPPGGGGGGSSSGDGGSTGGGGSSASGGGGSASAPDLALTLDASRPTAVAGDVIVYRIEVRLANPTLTSGVTRAVVTDTLPAGVELVSTSANRGPGCSGTSTLTCNLDFLSGGLVGAVDVTVRVTTAGSLVNTASVAAPEADPNPANNSASVTVSAPPILTPPVADLAPRLARAGQPTIVLRVLGGGRFARVRARLRADQRATVTLVARDLRTGKRLTLRRGSRIASTILKQPGPTATTLVGKAGLFPLKALIPAGELTRGAGYQLVLTATNGSGKVGKLRIRFLAP
jgi:uncharacterized repeat protein (TIGR01451 family)